MRCFLALTTACFALAAQAAPDVAYQSRGLSWARPSTAKPIYADAKVSYANAEARCAGLGPGWRIPSREEIRANWFVGESLSNDYALKKALDPDNIDSLRVWASTKDRYEDGQHWAEGLSYRDKADRPQSVDLNHVVCVNGTSQTAQKAPAPNSAASAGKALPPKLTLQASEYGEKVRKHDEKVQKSLAATEARSVKEQAEAEKRLAEERREAKDRAAASYKPCPAGITCNTSK